MPSFLTKVYAVPAPKPPRTPNSAGISSGLSKLGFIINILPANAVQTPIICTSFGFSFNRNTEKIIAKNGDNLLSILASDKFILLIA